MRPEATGQSAPEAATVLEQATTDEQIGILALEDIRAIFDVSSDDRLFSEEVAERLHEFEDRPWSEYGRQRKPITKNQISRILRPFKINPTTVRRGERTGKGYKIEQFHDAFARYLQLGQNSARRPDSPIQTVTTSQPRDTAAFGPNQTVTIDPDVTVWNRRKPAVDKGCDGVTVEIRENETCTHLSCDSEEDRAEREAIQAIDGEAALCVHCSEFVRLDEEQVPVAGGRVLHERCYDAYLGFGQSSNGPGAEPTA